MLDSFLNWLSSSPVVSLLSFLLAVAGVAVSFYLYFKSKETKEPVYLQKSHTIIKDSASVIDGLEITYNKSDIRCLTLTRVAFWNAGKGIIEGYHDIASTDEVRIVLPLSKAMIINAEVVFEKRKASQLAISEKNNEVYITFEFLGLGDGAIFEIYHTSNVKEDLIFKGTFKGETNLRQARHEKGALLDKMWETVLGLVPELLRGSLMTKFIFVLMLPFFIIASPFDELRARFPRIPKEYSDL